MSRQFSLFTVKIAVQQLTTDSSPDIHKKISQLCELLSLENLKLGNEKMLAMTNS